MSLDEKTYCADNPSCVLPLEKGEDGFLGLWIDWKCFVIVFG